MDCPHQLFRPTDSWSINKLEEYVHEYFRYAGTLERCRSNTIECDGTEPIISAVWALQTHRDSSHAMARDSRYELLTGVRLRLRPNASKTYTSCMDKQAKSGMHFGDGTCSHKTPAGSAQR